MEMVQEWGKDLVEMVGWSEAQQVEGLDSQQVEGSVVAALVLVARLLLARLG